MKKLLFLVLLLVLLVIYCEAIEIESISFKNKEIKLKTFERLELEYDVLPIDATGNDVIITSGNEDVIFVLNKELIAVKPGETYITVASSTNTKVKSSIKVIVTNPDIEQVLIAEKEIHLNLNEDKDFVYSILPELADKDVEITSSDEKVAFVFYDKIVGVGLGEATITVSSKKDPNVKDTCKVIVSDYPIEKISLENKDIKLKVSESHKLKFKILPEKAIDSQLDYVSSDENVAIVVNGDVIGINPGVVTITVLSKSDSNVKDTCKVVVYDYDISEVSFVNKEIKLYVDETKNIELKKLSNIDIDKSFVCESNDEDVMIVLKDKIVALSPGEAYLTVYSKSNPKLTDTCKVIVKKNNLEKVTFLDKYIVIKVKEERKLKVEIIPKSITNPDLIYTSSNQNLVRVVDGKVIALKPGKVIITITSKSNPKIKDTCKVKIIK